MDYTASVARRAKNGQLIKWIAGAAALVGTLDLLSAYVDVYISSGKNSFEIVSKYIASGWMGTSAFSGGNGVIVLGIISHFLIATLFTIIFFWIYPRLSLWSQNRVLTGFIYGIVVWAIMKFAVVPVSNVPAPPGGKFINQLKAMAILIVMIGLPLSFIAYNYFRKYPPVQRVNK